MFIYSLGSNSLYIFPFSLQRSSELKQLQGNSSADVNDLDNKGKDDDKEEDDINDADDDGPTVDAHVDLAEKKCKYHIS